MILYRYDLYIFGMRSSVELERYEITKETPCGYWIRPAKSWMDNTRWRWMNKNALRPFAYTTKQAALEAFIERKQRYLRILNDKVYQTKKALRIAQAKYERNKNEDHGGVDKSERVRASLQGGSCV